MNVGSRARQWLANFQYSRSRAKGDEIRARIAANRVKRLRIAEAMKREAGVTEHNINSLDLSGLAYLGTGRIYSPEGRQMRELATLAHECGHIFLHSSAPGLYLADHVKEYEAECYANQAFRAYGMKMPKWINESGRAYVASWIEKDRLRNVPLDTFAEFYAYRGLSPHHRMRITPQAWGDGSFGAAISEIEVSYTEQINRAVAAGTAKAATSVAMPLARVASRCVPARGGLVDEARLVGRMAYVGWVLGTGVALFALLGTQMMGALPVDPDAFDTSLKAMVFGLLTSNIVVLWRTMTAPAPSSSEARIARHDRSVSPMKDDIDFGATAVESW